MTDDLTTIEVDQFYPHPPAKVWRALTTPDLLARWLMEPTGFEPVSGNRFRMQARPIPEVNFSGQIRGEVLEVVEPKLLRITWNDAAVTEDSGWVLSWQLHPEGKGTRMLFTHTGFDPDNPISQLSRTRMSGGWPGLHHRLAGLLDAQ
ncbi:SRPBCC domain-containing protein [Nocardia brasiliensis]|uniref:SRPBCC domain-containing protein n=1 Tax=Nocardia brasiliensis TaxID=37326 RepID=UPI0037B5D23A